MSAEISDLEVSADSFFHGRVVVYQKKRGYRFAVDAPILADFLPASDAPALEVGTGCGIVSLLALYLGKFPSLTGVEIQEDLCRLARFNAAANGLEQRLRVVCADFNRMYRDFRGVSLIFANPPFAPLGRGRLSAHRDVRLAKFEVTLTLADLLEKSAAILAPAGRLLLIFPRLRYNELLAVAAAAGFHLRRSREVRPFADRAADRMLLQLGKRPGSSASAPPLTVFARQGVYSPEMMKILTGQANG